MPSEFDPVGEREIADRLGVKPKTVNVWRLRGLLPEPEAQVSGHPAWRWETIKAWAERSGRLSERKGNSPT